MISMFAIPNCNTVRKARDFLERSSINYQFIDFKKTPPTREQIEKWSEFFGDLPVNKKGTTYRKMKDCYEPLSHQEKIFYLLTNVSLIKRPVLEKNGEIIAIGFDQKRYSELLMEIKSNGGMGDEGVSHSKYS